LRSKRIFFALFTCFVISIFSTQALGRQTDANVVDFASIQNGLATIQESPELLEAVDRTIASLGSNTPVSTRISLDLWKLKILNDISDTERTSDFGKYIYQTYERSDYLSEEQFGDTMQQIVQAISKTLDLDLSFEIIRDLRERVYKTPSPYLSFIIDRSLMEIYIETFDYERALETELYIANNKEYSSLKALQEWKPTLHNEIAFLYNRLGNGSKALEHLDQAKRLHAVRNLPVSEAIKANAINNGNRGRAYLLLGKYSEAEKMGQEVLNAAKTLDENYLEALGYRIMGSAAYNLGEYSKANKMLRSGIELADTYNIATMQKHLYQDYALFLESGGQYKNALTWERKRSALEQKATNTAAAARMALNQAEGSAVEAHRELVTLRRENEVQRQLHSKNNYIKGLLFAVVLSLGAVAAILAYFFSMSRKTQRKLALSEDKANRNSNNSTQILCTSPAIV